MASARVGGTKSRLSGTVGNTVYRVVKNPNGTYSQVVTVKGVTTANYTTPRLQAQRMVTGMVESMMKQLKKVAGISMQSGANKTKSLNAFASFNMRLVAQDCQAHWDSGNQFVYPVMSTTKQYPDDLGGLYMISAGTLQFNLFDEYGEDLSWGMKYKDSLSWKMELYTMRWTIKSGVTTVGQFFDSYHMTRLDKIVLCGFLAGSKNYDPETGDVDEFYKHLYIIMQPNPKYPDNTPLTEEVIRDIFQFDANDDFVLVVRRDGDGFAVGWAVNNYDSDNLIPYMAGFSISYLDGKKKVSSSYYKLVFGDGSPWLGNHAPTDVFGSWMGQPNIIKYPNIF